MGPAAQLVSPIADADAVILEPAVRAGGLLRPGRPVVVLLSGGCDSTALVDLAARIAGPAAVRAVHVNYGLRPAAGSDEAACRALCATLGVPLTVAAAGPRPPSGNLQAWARDVRYAKARELAGGGDVAAGHTAGDQAETVLYRLASSPSRRAVLGMRPRDGDLVRPLLRFTRAQTAGHCRATGLRWVEDASNGDPRYARNRIRAALVPALEAIHPAAVANIAAVAEILREEAELLDALVDEALAGRAAIELTELRALPGALARLVVQRLADGAAGRPAPGVARRAQEVCALPSSGEASLDLPGGVRALARAGTLSFVRTPHAGGV